jgi:hypothetical protein
LHCLHLKFSIRLSFDLTLLSIASTKNIIV